MSARADLVIPTIGRPALRTLLRALAGGEGPRLGLMVIVDDRRGPRTPLPVHEAVGAAHEVRVVRGKGAGPAAARNTGWRLTSAPWVAFLDDDVVPERLWRARLAADLDAVPLEVAGSQGVIRVPRPSGRRPTDHERGVIGLERAAWATADMAYRRSVLGELGGFDERFRRAYREDADFALRALSAGHRLVRGRREVRHPIGAPRASASLRAQAGNADDVLMRALHGRDWRARSGAHAGRRRRHLAITAAAGLAIAGAASDHRRTALVGAACWAAGTAELAIARIAPGPRTAREVALMAATSAALPIAAAWHTARGVAGRRRALADRLRSPRPVLSGPAPAAVLLDRDGTLVVDVPYNGDPALVTPTAGARDAVERLRRAGLPMAVISNQSGIARGLLGPGQVAAVNHRVEELLGTIGPWFVCPHGPGDGCACRKPHPGMVIDAARALGVSPTDCVVIGDIGADIEAAHRAGARAILVPTARTRAREIELAPTVAADLPTAVSMLLDRTP